MSLKVKMYHNPLSYVSLVWCLQKKLGHCRIPVTKTKLGVIRLNLVTTNSMPTVERGLVESGLEDNRRF